MGPPWKPDLSHPRHPTTLQLRSREGHFLKSLAHLCRKQLDFIRRHSRAGKDGSFYKDQKKATLNKAMRTERTLSHKQSRV